MKENIMKWVLFAGVVVGMAACGWANKEAVQAWLDAYPQDAQVDVSGKWSDPGGGVDYETGHHYGPSFLMLFQNGNKVTGSFRGKELMGIVSQNRVYMAALKSGAVYFTLHLTYDEKTGSLYGKNCEFWCPEVKDDCQSIAFVR
jgi:hypothetical protein